MVPLLESAVGFGGRGGDFASLALVARLSQPNGVVLLVEAGGSFSGGWGDGDLAAFVAFACAPQGTDGKDAEKLGNLDGRGGGFMGRSFSVAALAV